VKSWIVLAGLIALITTPGLNHLNIRLRMPRKRIGIAPSRLISKAWGYACAPGTQNAARFDVLAALTDAYEAHAWPIEAPDPVMVADFGNIAPQAGTDDGAGLEAASGMADSGGRLSNRITRI
jgi:hypothetical protein